MDSEALLADHQATDGIVEEKNTVKEKRLNGEESKDEENAADRVVLRDSVIDCSKMPSSAMDKNGELEAPLETAEASPIESNHANSAVETREIEARLEDQKEVGREVEQHVLTDSVSAKVTDDIEVVAGEVEKQVLNTPVVDSSSTEIAEESREVEAEVEQQVSSDSGIAVSDVEKQILEVEELEEEQIQPEETEDVNAETNEVALSVLSADEIGNTEDKIVGDEKEAAIEVQEQALSDSSTSTLTNGKRLESKLIDDEQEVPVDAEQKVPSNESAEVEEAKIDNGEIEVETQVEQQFPSDTTNADGNQEVTTKAEKHVATETIDVTSIVVTADEEEVTRAEDEKQIPIEEGKEEEVEIEVEKQFPSDSGGTTCASTLAFVTAAEVGEAEAKIEDDEKEAATEAQEQVPIGSDTKRPEYELLDDDQEVSEEAKKQISSEEGKTEVEPGVEQQFPSDSGSPTSVTVVTERTGEIEAEYANDNKEVKTEAEKQVATETNDVTELVDDNQEAVVFAEEQVLIESSNKEIDAELKDNKQEEEEEAEVNQGHEADAANDNGLVLAEEETDNATVDSTSNNSNVTELKTINLVLEDTGTDHTSGVQTAGEISQPEVEVETNKIDSTREEKPNVSAESVDMKDNISEDKTSMDNLNDANMIDQVPRSNAEEAKGPTNDERVREINDHSQTDAKDIDIEMSKEDKITETNDEFEGKKSSEGIGIAEGEKEDIFKVGKVILDEDSNKIEKPEVAKEKPEDSQNDSTITDETTKSAGENADASIDLSVENKTSEDQEEEESKDESVNRDYVEAPKDTDVKKEIATAVSALVDAENKKESEKTIDESSSPKSADPVKLEEEVPRESAPPKSSPRRSNNIISKVKHQIVKAKKAIMGKSPSSKDMSPKSKEEVK